jgi:hypothetical protein
MPKVETLSCCVILLTLSVIQTLKGWGGRFFSTTAARMAVPGGYRMVINQLVNLVKIAKNGRPAANCPG